MPEHVRLEVEPLPGPRARQVLDELAGRSLVHRIWRGQPGARCPWRAEGATLVLDTRHDQDAEAWLRFLLREVLAPTSRGGTARARAVGILEQHRVRGVFTAPDADGRLVRWRVQGLRTIAAGYASAERRGDPGPAS